MKKMMKVSKKMIFSILILFPFLADAQTPQANIQRYWKGNVIDNVINNSNSDMNTVYLYNVGTHKFINAGSFWGTSVVLYEVGVPFTLDMRNVMIEGQGSTRTYSLFSNAIQTKQGSYMGWVREQDSPGAPEDHDRVYTDRLDALDGNGRSLSRWTFTLCPTVYNGSTVYYINCYSAYDNNRGRYSAPKYLVADKNNPLSSVTTYELKYNDTEPSVQALGDSTGLWKIVTLKDLKDDFKQRYATNENPSDATFFLINQGFMRSEIAKTKTQWKEEGLNYTTGIEGSIDGVYATESPDSARKNGKLYHAEIFGAQNGTVSQTVTVNKPGWYKVSCSGFYKRGDGSNLIAEIFARDNEHLDEERSNASYALYPLDNPLIDTRTKAGQAFYNDKYTRNTIMVYIVGDDNDENFSRSMTFGIRVKDASSPNDWVAFDDFQMKYCGTGTLYLDEDENNLDYINAQVDSQYSTTMLLQRSFVKDGWNSIILPVNLTGDQFESAFGSTAKLSRLKGQNPVKRTQIDFESVALGEENRQNRVMEAGKLYIIKPTRELRKTKEGGFNVRIGQTSGTDINLNINGIYFTAENVSLNNVIRDEDAIIEEAAFMPSNNDDFQFCGTYINSGDNKIVPENSYVINKDGKWYRTTKKYSIKGFRCWIATIAGTAGSDKLTFTIDGVEESSVTAIHGLQDDNLPLRNNKVYNLNGQLVREDSSSLESLPKGIYIIGNKKYVVR